MPGLQGCYLYLVGGTGQGMYQALFMSATSVGRMLGSYWVGYASEHYGDCAIWLVVG